MLKWAILVNGNVCRKLAAVHPLGSAWSLSSWSEGNSSSSEEEEEEVLTSSFLYMPIIYNLGTLKWYRPFSILPLISKLLERIVHFQLNSFLVNNNILSPYQSGFRRGHSTVTALVKVCDDIRANMDNQLITILALLDFSNAFNTVDFDILLAILKSINISEAAIDWFHSYLNGRQQCVYSQNKFSSYSSLTAGVPQGGVLSPLLFAIFINTVSKQLSSSFHLYADDLQVYIGSPSHSICEGIAEVNNELLSIYTWSNSYGLCVNPNKSQVIIIGSRQQLAKVNFSTLLSVRFNSTDLVLSTTVKNLGPLIDTTLSWSPQVAE
ncbi:jg27265, partial [Pararge aegeria aegeria]